MYILNYDLCPLRANTKVLGLCLNCLFPVDFMFYKVLFNITHENRPPGTTQRAREPILCTVALFTPQIYIEIELHELFNLWKVWTFLRPPRFGQNGHYTFSDSDMWWLSDCTLSWIPFQNLLKPVPCETFHSREAFNRVIQSLASFLLCDILGAKTSRLPDS